MSTDTKNNLPKPEEFQSRLTDDLLMRTFQDLQTSLEYCRSLRPSDTAHSVSPMEMALVLGIIARMSSRHQEITSELNHLVEHHPTITRLLCDLFYEYGFTRGRGFISPWSEETPPPARLDA
jgi:hypothetical protein